MISADCISFMFFAPKDAMLVMSAPSQWVTLIISGLEMPGKNPLKDAHAAVNALVLNAYGFSPKTDLLKQLLELNIGVAERIDAGGTVTAPGIPINHPNAAQLVTEDCVTS